MKTLTIDVSISRRQYYSENTGMDRCPECGGVLINQECTIIIFAKTKNDEAELMTNSSGSHFCPKCPVVVFDSYKLEKAVKIGFKGYKILEYFVVGIVDLESIQEEKRHLEIGINGNPVPLVSFLPDLNTNTVISDKKPGRNDNCSCGSGLKYKKCCGK